MVIADFFGFCGFCDERSSNMSLESLSFLFSELSVSPTESFGAFGVKFSLCWEYEGETNSSSILLGAEEELWAREFEEVLFGGGCK